MPLDNRACVSKVPMTRQKITDTLLRYFHTDAIFCRDQAGTPLAARQAEVWDPLAQWVSERLESPVSVSDSIFGVEQPSWMLALWIAIIFGGVLTASVAQVNRRSTPPKMSRR